MPNLKKPTKIKSKKVFQALNENVQILPIKDPDEKKRGIVVKKLVRERPARGTVVSVGEGRYLSDGTLIKPSVEVGDTVIYNPHMIGYELEEDGVLTMIINSNAIYGRYK